MFDRIVVVDWSASSRPVQGADSVWIGVSSVDGGRVATVNPSTRAAAVDVLVESCLGTGRTLIGVDFSLGYPAGTAAALGLSGEPWRATWALLTELVEDHDDNVNNRFEVAADLNSRVAGAAGPFWGCPPSRRSNTLTSTKVAASALAEWRTVESTLRSAGRRPFSSWQLLGAGSVGSQTLLGIPRLVQLESILAAANRTVEIWPFCKPSGVSSADVVVAEVWPSLFDLDPADGRVRDEQQVVGLARALRRGVSFDVFARLDADTIGVIRSEEGWVLGVEPRPVRRRSASVDGPGSV
jgi:precorrin-8X/cobalt-precorrin-8 methylmutase